MDRTEAKATLKAGLAKLITSEGYQAYLAFRAKFWDYSFGNTIMIMCQRPNASHVAGYKTWQSLGRQVKKGEKGIAIFAPMVYHKKDEQGQATDETGLSFRVVYVFDVTQTDGAELPARPLPVALAGDAPGTLQAALTRLIQTNGFTISFGAPIGEAFGMTDFPSKSIIIREGLSPAQTLKTTAHECAHMILHGPNRPAGLTRDEGETEAESTAYLFMAHQGIDASGYSFPYLASWGTDEKALSKAGKRIDEATSALLNACELVPA